MPLLSGHGQSPRHELFYLQGARPEAVRQDAWKLRLAPPDTAPELYNLDRDPGERLDVANDHPDVVAKLRARLGTFAASLR
jgi:arylsulfatase A-like enzyme